MDNYYLISSLSMGAADPWEPWYEEFRETWLCHGCLTPKPGLEEVDVYLDTVPDNTPLNFVGGALISYARRDFFECVGLEEIDNTLYLGRVFDSEGKEYKNFVSYRGKSILHVRGNEQSTYRICDVCGAKLYFALGRKYIMADRLTGSNLYKGDGTGDLIVNETLYERIASKRWRKLAIQKLPVLEKPVDGREDLVL